jgi:hypothetical protein
MTNVLDEESPKKKRDVFFLRNISTNVNIYTRTSTHPYEHIHVRHDS